MRRIRRLLGAYRLLDEDKIDRKKRDEYDARIADSSSRVDAGGSDAAAEPDREKVAR